MIETISSNIIPQNDEERLAALHRYRILDTPPEESFNNIVRLMADAFDVPIALISLVDKDRVYFKGNVGMPGVKNTDRNISLCSFAILSPAPTIFDNPLHEPCLLTNPLVHGTFGLRFYAGAPLITHDGYNIGSVCLIDKKERSFSDRQKDMLVRFAKMVMNEIELRVGAQYVDAKAAEEEVARKSAEDVKGTLSSVLEALPEKGWTANEQGEANFLTKGWYEYTGQAVGGAIGKGWAAAIHPDDIEQLYQNWVETVKTGNMLRHEARLRNKNGEYRWHLVKSLPIRDSSGKIFLWGGTLTDIHDRKVKTEELERKVWERTIELQRSNRSLEEFAYAASHDLQAPIRKIITFSDRLKNKLKEKLDEQDLQYLTRIENASRRMSSLIDDLLTYSSVSRGKESAEKVDLGQCVRTVLEDLELEVQDKRAKVLVGSLPEVTGHRLQLQQVFQNLISNALKYSKPLIAPEISITSQKVTGSELLFSFPGADAKKEYILIEVTDNGIGFEQQYAEKIFNVFTRLHGNSEYNGTGVGLSIVRRVVENHNGYIWAESKPGEGATFRILLPLQ